MKYLQIGLVCMCFLLVGYNLKDSPVEAKMKEVINTDAPYCMSDGRYGFLVFEGKGNLYQMQFTNLGLPTDLYGLQLKKYNEPKIKCPEFTKISWIIKGSIRDHGLLEDLNKALKKMGNKELSL